MPNKSKYRFIDLIMYIIDFFINRRKLNDIKYQRKEQMKKEKAEDKLLKEYEKIDKSIAGEKANTDDKDLENKLNDMF